MHRRLLIFIPLLLGAFGLRLLAIDNHDMNIDETWTFVYSYIIPDDENASFINTYWAEPNNAPHIFLVNTLTNDMNNAFGLRWLSILAGVVSVALVARIAARLFGDRASLIALLLAIVAYGGFYYARIGRPYMLANTFALLSFMAFIERRRWLMLGATMGVPLFHVGAMPLVFVEDVLVLLRIKPFQRESLKEWIALRAIAFIPLVLMLYLVYLLREINGKVMSSGQDVPSLAQITDHLGGLFYTGDAPLVLAALALATGAGLVYGLFVRRTHALNLGVLVFALVATYSAIVVMAIISDGPIKFVHISQAGTIALLIIVGVLVTLPRTVRLVAIAGFVLLSVASIGDHFTEPYRYFNDLTAEINAHYEPADVVYSRATTILWGMDINGAVEPDVSTYPLAEAERVYPSWYMNYLPWDETVPPACDPQPRWTAHRVSMYYCDG